MANGILKGLAVAAGTGLAMGFSSGRARVRVAIAAPPSIGTAAPAAAADPAPAAWARPEDDFLNIEPLLDRVERLEARIDSMEQRPLPAYPAPYVGVPAGYAAALAELERRVEENTRELELLRVRVTDAERHAADSAASIQRKVDRTREEIPALVEQGVSAAVDDLSKRFSAEIEQAHQRTLATFERAIDEKISSRIGSIERALAEQAGSIDALRDRATETDQNLQRLVTAIEKLCERAQLIPPAAETPLARVPGQRPAHYEARQPFESHLHDALRGAPVVPMVRPEEAKQEDPVAEAETPVPAFAGLAAPRKSRFLFRNLLIAGFGLLAATRFLR